MNLLRVGDNAFAQREARRQVLQIRRCRQHHDVRNAGHDSDVLPVVGLPGEPGILTTPDSHAWFTGTAKSAPNWKNMTISEAPADQRLEATHHLRGLHGMAR